MANRKITANRIFDGEKFLLDTLLEIDHRGRIEAISECNKQDSSIEYYDGIITPGFINCHCHLELSHLKDKIPAHTGLKNFVSTVMQSRNHSSNYIREQAKTWDEYMWHKGIVGVGDICNTTVTLPIKKQSKIVYKNFIEAAGFLPSKADHAMQTYEKVMHAFEDANMDAFISPHAPYSVSVPLFRLINKQAAGKIISMHNQESADEDLFFTQKKGAFVNLYEEMKADISFFEPIATSGLQHVLPLLSNAKNILLIHNTFTTEKDVDAVRKIAKQNSQNIFWVLCANANEYIENRLPPVDMLIKHKAIICLGTDSLASNDNLDITKEIQLIKKNFPPIPDELLLQAATRNGALALEMSDKGSLVPNSIPGLNLLDDNLNFIQKII